MLENDQTQTNRDIYNKLEPSAKEWIDNETKIIDSELKKWKILIALALLSPLFLLLLKPVNESIGMWVQRSGAIIVVLALLAEIKAISAERLAITSEMSFLYCNIYLNNKYKKKVKIVTFATYFVVAIGTLIWGYGDILVSFFH